MQGDFCQHRRTVFLQTDTGDAARAHIGDENVHQGEAQHRKAAGERHHAQHLAASVQTQRTHRVNDDDGKHRRDETVHRLIAFNQPSRDRMLQIAALRSL